MGDGRPISVLVVDDDEEVGKVAEGMLSEDGFVALRVTSAPAALAVLADRPDIDVLFTDVVMPGIDGIILADMAHHKFPDLRIIYTTGFLDVARSLPGVVHGETVHKPYGLQQLRAAVRRAVARPRMAG